MLLLLVVVVVVVVVIVFQLDAVRSLTAARIHCNNAFGRDVGVFSAAQLHFSISGAEFDVHSQPVFYMAARDAVVQQPRYVTVPVEPARAARFVRLLLYFDRRWIMISEVHFDTGRPTSLCHVYTSFTLLATFAFGGVTE